LCVAAALVVAGFGFIHVITGITSPYELPIDIVLKESFGYRETFVDAERILALPYRVATSRYPRSCRVLQRRGYMHSGRRFEARMKAVQRSHLRDWEAQFEAAVGRPQGRWQDQLQGRLDAPPADPQGAQACNQRGIACAGNAQYEAALAEFSRAIGKAPAYAEAFHNRALIYIAIGNLGQAAADFGSVIEIKPDCLKGRIRRGCLYARMNRHEEAIADFTEVIEMDPTHAEALFRRALAHYAKGEYGKAQQDAAALQSLGVPVPSDYLEALRAASATRR
jgi:tetratricopeptide (TPR) repeat protein